MTWGYSEVSGVGVGVSVAVGFVAGDLEVVGMGWVSELSVPLVKDKGLTFIILFCDGR